MEAILHWFFDNFEQSERNSLHARYKRQAMVKYFNILIEECRLGENTTAEKVVRDAVREILRFHENARKKNGGVCIMGKYHDILYIAVKLCYDWQLKDTEMIATLLDTIFHCESTFERILIGALFGTRAPFYIAGWKSDFQDQEENVRAMVYYLDHATNASLEYNCSVAKTRYVDVPIESCGKLTALKIVVQLGLSDKLHILLRYGALILNEHDGEPIVAWLIKKLYEYKGCYPYNFVACLQLLLRVIPNVYTTNSECTEPNLQRDALFENYPELIDHGLIPASRCGIVPTELKHLCRCAIRRRLWENYELPNGIRKIAIPSCLYKYLDILED